MYKNWKAICKVSNPQLQLLMLTADDATLKKLRRGFPELFVSERPEQPGPFPLSYLRRLADDFKAKHFAENKLMHEDDLWNEIVCELPEVMKAVGMMHFFCQPPCEEKDELRGGIQVSAEGFNRCWKKFHGGYTRKKIFPWELRLTHIDGIPYFLGEFSAEYNEPGDFSIYPAALVDLGA